MKILLIRDRQDIGMGFRNLMHIEPLGLEMIAGALKGHEVKILDSMDRDEIIKIALDFEPDMCGLSCSFTVDFKGTLEIARRLKAEFKEIFVFVGGHHAAINPHHFVDTFVDAVVVGEGEETSREMAEVYEAGGDLKQVQGLVLNQCKGINGQYYTKTRCQIKNLDELPYPRRDLVSEYRSKYYLGLRRPAYALETARGCPFKCKFCSVWRFYDNRYRMKSAGRVFEEIVSIPGETILITDDNFFANVERAYRIGELLKEAGVKKYFNIQARSDDVVSYPELIDLWREVGLSSLFIGFEQVDQEGLNKLDKKNTIKNNEAALYELRKKKMSVISSFIVDPENDIQDFEATYNYIKKNNIKTPSFSVLTPLPGTVLYEEMKDKIITENYCLYDLLHVVLPTSLGLEKFYTEFARLWKLCYKTSLPDLGLNSFKDIFFYPSNWVHSARIFKGLKCMFDANNYLMDHR